MSEDADELPARERARVRHRDRKVRGPKVVVDNAGLKKLALHLAEKRRLRRQPPPAKPPAARIRTRGPMRGSRGSGTAHADQCANRAAGQPSAGTIARLCVPVPSRVSPPSFVHCTV